MRQHRPNREKIDAVRFATPRVETYPTPCPIVSQISRSYGFETMAIATIEFSSIDSCISETICLSKA
jgi:hypothetical protein